MNIENWLVIGFHTTVVMTSTDDGYKVATYACSPSTDLSIDSIVANAHADGEESQVTEHPTHDEALVQFSIDVQREMVTEIRSMSRDQRSQELQL